MIRGTDTLEIGLHPAAEDFHQPQFIECGGKRFKAVILIDEP